MNSGPAPALSETVATSITAQSEKQGERDLVSAIAHTPTHLHRKLLCGAGLGLVSQQHSGGGAVVGSWSSHSSSSSSSSSSSAVSAVTLPKLNVTNRKAKAVYPCEAEHDSELSFQVGAIFDDEPQAYWFRSWDRTAGNLTIEEGGGEVGGMIYSREPGWLEGVLEGKRGLIPENYVEML
ncbi:hypothetical protein JZ751_006043 [Albula glossodonta]|uniref:SH3 domain-containing protein n=1 Tax=Albula glossodonta TaxID=121402 RepID=A0A8T2P636_9TELE|nr:hypothetical protein JZ751_006043 [Albula glossodonta]